MARTNGNSSTKTGRRIIVDATREVDYFENDPDA